MLLTKFVFNKVEVWCVLLPQFLPMLRLLMLVISQIQSKINMAPNRLQDLGFLPPEQTGLIGHRISLEYLPAPVPGSSKVTSCHRMECVLCCCFCNIKRVSSEFAPENKRTFRRVSWTLALVIKCHKDSCCWSFCPVALTYNCNIHISVSCYSLFVFVVGTNELLQLVCFQYVLYKSRSS